MSRSLLSRLFTRGSLVFAVLLISVSRPMKSVGCFDPTPAVVSIRDAKGHEALVYLEQVADRCRQDPEWLYLNSRSLWLLNQFDSALVSIERAIGGQESDPEFHRFAAVINAKLGDVSRARQHIRELTRLRGAYSGSAFEEESEILLAVTLAQQGKTNQAILVLQPLSEREPPNLRALYYMGLFQQSTAEYERAVRTFSRVLRIDPKNEEARRQLAIIQVESGDPRQALPLLEELNARTPSAEVLFHLSRAYFRLGRFEEAKKRIRQAMDLVPAEPKYHRQLGVVLLRSGALEEGRAEMRLAEQLERQAGF